MRQVAVRRLHPVNVNHAAICPVVHPFRSYGLVTFVTINAGGQEFPPLTRLLGQPGIIVQHGPPYFYNFFLSFSYRHLYWRRATEKLLREGILKSRERLYNNEVKKTHLDKTVLVVVQVVKFGSHRAGKIKTFRRIVYWPWLLSVRHNPCVSFYLKPDVA